MLFGRTKTPGSGFPRTRRSSGSSRSLRSLLSTEQLNQAIARESQRVDRKKSGDLSLVLFRLPNARPRALSSVRLIRTILRRIRVTDDLGWFDKRHLGLLLPDTSAAGAWALAQQVCDTVSAKGARPRCVMYSYPADGQAMVRDSNADDEMTRRAIKLAS